MNKFLTSRIVAVLCLALFSFQSFAGTITGNVQNAQSGPVANGTFSFTLNAPATLAGTATIATMSVNCYTDANGAVVNEPNPLIGPILSTNLGSGTLAAGTYFVRITYRDATGESFPSPELSINLAAPGTLIVTPPVKQPAGATSYRVYIGTASGNETLQGTVTVSPGSWGSYSQSSALAAGAALPVSNTTVCTVIFNDQLTPSFTCYDVGLTSSTGANIPGFPQWWYVAGGSAGTVNISSGTPQSNVCQGSGIVYPQAVLTLPPFNATQTINGGLNLNGFPLTAGPITAKSDNLVLWVGGASGYSSMQACHDALPSTGGKCRIVPGYTETLSANLAISKNGTIFEFEGPAIITMGSNQVTVAAGTSGVSIFGPLDDGGHKCVTVPCTTYTNSTEFIYTGNSTAVVVGANTPQTQRVFIHNIFFNLSGAGNAAIGIDLINVAGHFNVSSNVVLGNGAVGNTGTGILTDGGANFTCDGEIDENEVINFLIEIGTANMSCETVYKGNQLTAGAIPGSIFLDFEATNFGNVVLGGNYAGAALTLKVAGTGNANYFILPINSETADANFGGTTSNNVVEFLGQAGASQNPPVVTDTGTNNSFYWAGTYKRDAAGNITHSGSLQQIEHAAPSGVASSDIIYADSTAHRWKMNNNNGGTDSVVGAATTDTLTKKTLTGAGSGNAVTLLNQQGAVAAITGNGTDQTLYTFTIPANTIQAGKGFRVKWFGSNNAGAATLSLKLKIGATTLSTFTIPTTSNYNETAEIVNNAGVQNAQTWAAGGQAGTATLLDTFGTSAENFANAIAVTVTGNIANPNTFQGGLFMVELIQ